jgi:hypothetical protein
MLRVVVLLLAANDRTRGGVMFVLNQVDRRKGRYIESTELRVVGWGPFPIPGERRRREAALRQAREIVEALDGLEED